MANSKLLKNYNFSHSYSVVLDQPLDVVFSALGRADNLPRVMSLLDGWSDVKMGKREEILLPEESATLAKSCTRTMPAHDKNGDTSIGQRVLPRQPFSYRETVPAVFGLVQHTAEIIGTMTWDDEEKVSLFETYEPSHGIDVWRARIFEAVSDGEAEDSIGEGKDVKGRTRVSETIKGRAPLWVKYLAQKETVRLHRAHMDVYYKLFM